MSQPSKRAQNILDEAELTLEAVTGMTDAQLLAVPGVGPSVLQELRELAPAPEAEGDAEDEEAPVDAQDDEDDQAEVEAAEEAPARPESLQALPADLSPQGVWRPAKRGNALIYRNEDTGAEVPREPGLSIVEAIRRVRS